jgi:hypothetical protein
MSKPKQLVGMWFWSFISGAICIYFGVMENNIFILIGGVLMVLYATGKLKTIYNTSALVVVVSIVGVVAAFLLFGVLDNLIHHRDLLR